MKNVNQAEKAWPGVNYDIIRDWLKESASPLVIQNVADYPVSKRMQEFLDKGKLSIGGCDVII